MEDAEEKKRIGVRNKRIKIAINAILGVITIITSAAAVGPWGKIKDAFSEMEYNFNQQVIMDAEFIPLDTSLPIATKLTQFTRSNVESMCSAGYVLSEPVTMPDLDHYCVCGTITDGVGISNTHLEPVLSRPDCSNVCDTPAPTSANTGAGNFSRRLLSMGETTNQKTYSTCSACEADEVAWGSSVPDETYSLSQLAKSKCDYSYYNGEPWQCTYKQATSVDYVLPVDGGVFCVKLHDETIAESPVYHEDFSSCINNVAFPPYAVDGYKNCGLGCYPASGPCPKTDFQLVDITQLGILGADYSCKPENITIVRGGNTGVYQLCSRQINEVTDPSVLSAPPGQVELRFFDGTNGCPTGFVASNGNTLNDETIEQSRPDDPRRSGMACEPNDHYYTIISSNEVNIYTDALSGASTLAKTEPLAMWETGLRSDAAGTETSRLKTTSQMSLTSRNQMFWDPSCPLSPGNVENVSATTRSLANNQIAILVITIVMVVLINFLYGGWEFQQEDADGFEDDTHEQRIKRRRKFQASFISAIIKFIIMISVISTSISLADQFAAMSGVTCQTPTSEQLTSMYPDICANVDAGSCTVIRDRLAEPNSASGIEELLAATSEVGSLNWATLFIGLIMSFTDAYAIYQSYTVFGDEDGENKGGNGDGYVQPEPEVQNGQMELQNGNQGMQQNGGMGMQNQGMQNGGMGMQNQGMQNGGMGMQNQGMQNGGMGMQNQGMQNGGMGMQNQGMQNGGMGMQNGGMGMQNQGMGMQNQGMGMQGNQMGMQNQGMNGNGMNGMQQPMMMQ